MAHVAHSPVCRSTARRWTPRHVHWPALIAFVGVATVSGALAGLATRPDDWYEQLDKAPLNPPGAVFGPVWTVLYVMIGVAGYVAWCAPGHAWRRTAMVLWLAQLGLNLAWTPIFFGAHRPGWALAEMLVLSATIVATIAVFARRSRPAAALLVPYLLWVVFATYLTGYIVVNN
jgi:tryptophan-rich sensory protein